MFRYVFLLSAFALPSFAQPAVPSDAEIRAILADRIDAQKQSVGIVVGIVDPKGRRIVSYGALAKDDQRPLNGDTVYEIGSMTKVFTSLALMDMVGRGEVALDDPVAKYLPPEVKVPERAGKKITLRALSTQSSGLPRMPTNFTPKDLLNPYADYSVEQMYRFLSGYQLTRDIGEKYEYSNLGVGLLGHALSRRAGVSYEELIVSRIARPLEMKDTAVTLSPSMKERLAVGHNTAMRPTANWDIPTLAGAGALRSTANDLLTFLAANLGFKQTSLAKAMAAQISERHPAGGPDVEIAFGWHIFTAHGKTIYWHNGGTGGYRTFMGYDPAARLGVVALSNSSTPAGVDDIGHHLLDPAFPLLETRKHQEISVDPATFDRFTGQYAISPGFVLTVSRAGDELLAQATGQGQFRLLPEGPAEFFAKVTELSVTFHDGPDGKASGLTLRQGGRTTLAKRTGDAPPLRQHVAIKADPNIYDRYAGRYQLNPSLILTVTREGDRLMSQGTGQPKFELFPETERDFFVKEFEGQLTFQAAPGQKATGLILRQNGLTIEAKRLD